MPHADTVLLPICVAIALLGIILTGLAWRRGNKGRVLQGAALTIVPFGLYLTGLLGMLWDAVVALVRWAVRLVFSPTLWIGFVILALCVVLFVIGTVLVRLNPGSKRRQKSVEAAGTAKQPAVGAGRPKGAAAKSQQPVDPEMAEIEALLKSHGID
jgi:membrane-bound ClpP family serine protease